VSSDSKSLTRRVIEFLESYPGARPSDIANALGVSRAAVYKVLSYLKSRGIVRKVGSGYIVARQRAPERELSEETASLREQRVEARVSEESSREQLRNSLEQLRREVAELEKAMESISTALLSLASFVSSLATRSQYRREEALSEIVKNVRISDVDTLVSLLRASRSEEMCRNFVVLGYLAVKRDFLEELRLQGCSTELEKILVRGYELGSYEDLCLYV